MFASLGLESPSESAQDVLLKLEAMETNQRILLEAKKLCYQEMGIILDRFASKVKLPVHAAVAPIGGWQRTLLTPDITVKLLHCVAREAMAVEIKRMLIVIRSDQEAQLKECEAMQQLREDARRKELKLEYRIQKAANDGLAGAVLTGSEALLEEEPFVLMFPDDFGAAGKQDLKEMITIYKQTEGVVVAVRQYMPEYKRSRGLVLCEEGNANQNHKCLEIRRYIEANREHNYTPKAGSKESRLSKFVGFGRYIVSPKLRRYLMDNWTATKAKSLFDDAVDALAKEGVVYGWELQGEVCTLRERRQELKDAFDTEVGQLMARTY